MAAKQRFRMNLLQVDAGNVDEKTEDLQVGVMDDVVEINPALSIPRSELTYRATRAGGPGGQHVNTSSTRVELWWDVDASPSLDEAQRARIREKLAKRIGEDGQLRLASAVSRSQHQNRIEVTERFA